jgi:hypothetical protein
MFGCFVICGKLKAFLKKFWVYKWVASKFDVFFLENYGLQNFSQNFRDLYIKIHRQWGFRVDCYEIRGPFWEIIDWKHIVLKV